MNSEMEKKRKRDAHDGEGGSSSHAGAEGGGSSASAASIMSEMKAHMTRMQSEMNNMKGRLSRLDVLESRTAELEKRCRHYGEKCEYLNIRCGSLERAVQILAKEQKWEYSAPRIPHPYDVPGMECFLQTTEYIAGVCRNQKSGGHIDLDGGGFDGDDEDIILQHDDRLIPHWKEFINALQLNFQELDDFRLGRMQLSSSIIEILTPALKGRPFKVFDLSFIDFVDFDGLQFATEIIESNPKLREFRMAEPEMDSLDTDGLENLIQSIVSHPRIDSIAIEYCFRGGANAYDGLCTLIASGKAFSFINFHSNNIRTGGSSNIPNFLAQNPQLERLWLSKNHLNDDDAFLIALALKHNSNLDQLDLHGNDFTDLGWTALQKAVCDNSSLNSVFDSNHSCTIFGNFASNDLYNNKGEDRGNNRGYKIYRLLALRNTEGSNVRHLEFEFNDDESLNLVPAVLECVYKSPAQYRPECSHPVQPLSIMYEILRGWHIPALYENCGSS